MPVSSLHSTCSALFRFRSCNTTREIAPGSSVKYGPRFARASNRSAATPARLSRNHASTRCSLAAPFGLLSSLAIADWVVAMRCASCSCVRPAVTRASPSCPWTGNSFCRIRRLDGVSTRKIREIRIHIKGRSCRRAQADRILAHPINHAGKVSLARAGTAQLCTKGGLSSAMLLRQCNSSLIEPSSRLLRVTK